MKILYVNNFRGFKNSFIPFQDVNFFVGENSTGKSSILSLLRLMSTSQFWENDDFNIDDDIELGFFEELYSQNAKGKKEFQIGYCINEVATERVSSFNTILFNYHNEKGTPKLNDIRVSIEGFNFRIQLNKKQLRIFSKRVSYVVKTEDDFKFWIKDKNFESVAYKSYPSEDEFGRRISFFDIRDYIRKELPKEIKLAGLARPMLLPFSTWIAPIRTKPKRIYENFKLIFSSDGNHTPLLIKLILANQFKKNISRVAFVKAVKVFGKQSGLFQKIEVKNLGRDTSAPFTLNIYLSKLPLKITNVGYGVGQVLPLLTEILVTYPGRWFSIQQPEVHLHPRAQAALGEFIYEAASKRKKHFLIETHSDFIIDRFRYCLKHGGKRPSCQVLFFERKNDGNKVTSVSVDKVGQYSKDQPESFRSFFIKEELKLLSV